MNPADWPSSPAAERNKGAILHVLRLLLPANATVLELASGTGQHAADFAAQQPGWAWHPTEADASALPFIDARCAGLANIRPALALDVLVRPWPPTLGNFDAVYCANLLHIAPWATCAALMQGSAQHLVPGGLLLLYGPWMVSGEPLAPGNTAFDLDLRLRNAQWGLRLLSDVVREGQRVGMVFERQVAMPADNLMLVFRRRERVAPKGPQQT